MSEYDWVVKNLIVSQESVFNVADLYKMLKSWFDMHGFDFYEKEYLDTLKESGKEASIKWVADRKVDDYVKFHIEIRIRFQNLKDVKGKRGITNKGEIRFRFESFLEKDYEDNWEATFSGKFLRNLYDTFVIRGRLDKMVTDLKDETYEAYNEVKAFLKLHQYKG